MSLPWDSKSAEKSGSPNVMTPSPDSSRPDPSGKTASIQPNNRSASVGVFNPSSASPENSKAPFKTPSSGDDSPFSGGNSNKRGGSNSNISK